MPKPSLRDALLDAGFETLHAGGYSATGVAAIAAAARAPKGSFYNHFDSKEALAVEVLARYGRGRRLDLLTEPSVPALQRIRNHLDHLRADLAAYGYQRGCMYGNFAAEAPAGAPGVTAAVTAALGRWRTLLAATIREGQQAGDITGEVDADAAAQMIVDAWEGAALRAKADGDGGPVDNVIAFVFDRILSVP
ncbi:TetR family transcriptional regulator C-terminal domain-containing protein [Mycolicibacterium litorale]|uniref:Transcriptional regulator n=1 Tax=Mycolicibacterium litorale TaxID=758802 RepID=A0AAD1IJL0_9MYCO|nr:TetR family transcriptional regulator C-terminal domain-containing protein [Mycolicibacterium litorale]MCV7415355.1 TetR family transcriptional regulator C-terminal domain-containing protein [Mycolicibacterium litorale]TDY08609.1 TetR family transcriptional regulator [Mycolicibacterium litorale]BBY16535.1 transcriptional regulator [Mycolicibacterium litorale]